MAEAHRLHPAHRDGPHQTAVAKQGVLSRHIGVCVDGCCRSRCRMRSPDPLATMGTGSRPGHGFRRHRDVGHPAQRIVWLPWPVVGSESAGTHDAGRTPWVLGLSRIGGVLHKPPHIDRMNPRADRGPTSPTRALARASRSSGVRLDWRREPLTLQSDGAVVAASHRALAEQALALLVDRIGCHCLGLDALEAWRSSPGSCRE